MNISKKILIFFIYFIIILIIAILVYFSYKNHNLNKYAKYDEIISFSNNQNSEIVFYNISNDSVAICYYKLNNSKNKVNQDILIREFKKDKKISYENFKNILNKISNELNKNYTLDQNKIITYGGERLLVNNLNLEKIINIIDDNIE